MNKKLRGTLVVLFSLGIIAVITMNVEWRSEPPRVGQETVQAAAENSRRIQHQHPPLEDIPREGRARPASITAPEH